MRVWSAALVIALVAAGSGGARAQDAAPYRDTVRCYNAAAVYAQQFVVANLAAPTAAMIGYRDELRARAYAQGAALGKSKEAVRADFQDNTPAYVRKFFSFQQNRMALAPFGAGEIAHCSLDKVLKGIATH
jgi:hypothetical protein